MDIVMTELSTRRSLVAQILCLSLSLSLCLCVFRCAIWYTFCLVLNRPVITPAQVKMADMGYGIAMTSSSFLLAGSLLSWALRELRDCRV